MSDNQPDVKSGVSETTATMVVLCSLFFSAASTVVGCQYMDYLETKLVIESGYEMDKSGTVPDEKSVLKKARQE